MATLYFSIHTPCIDTLTRVRISPEGKCHFTWRGVWLTTRATGADSRKRTRIFKLISGDISRCRSARHSDRVLCPRSSLLGTERHSMILAEEMRFTDVSQCFHKSSFSRQFDKHPDVHKTQRKLFKERLSQDVAELSELLGNWEPIMFSFTEPRGTSLELIAVNPIF